MKPILWALLVVISVLPIFCQVQESSSADPLQVFVEGNNQFAFKYLRQLQHENPNDNLLVAPASLSLAFALLQNGANEQTYREIGEVFGRQELVMAQVNTASEQLLTRLASTKYVQRNYRTMLQISTSLWMRSPADFQPDIKRIAQKAYDASVNSLPVGARDGKPIDAFLAKSLGRSVNLPTPRLSKYEFAVITATLFDGKWMAEFDEKLTEREDFRLRDRTTRPVDMMQKDGRFAYLRQNAFQAVYLPYTADYGMYVFLPDDGDGIDEFAQSITPEKWKSWVKSFEPSRKGLLKMPRFDIEMSRDSTEDMKKLGMTFPFSSARSMAKLVTAPEGALLRRVLEDASIAITEKRTVVITHGAVGGVIGGIGGGYLTKPPEPFRMIVDHPFLFAIVDEETKSVLYIGVVTAPSPSIKVLKAPQR